jgi:hypothetical protein
VVPRDRKGTLTLGLVALGKGKSEWCPEFSSQVRICSFCCRGCELFIVADKANTEKLRSVKV